MRILTREQVLAIPAIEPLDEKFLMTEKLDKLVADMFETCIAHGGVGLAAPQVGIPRRLAVMVLKGGQRYALINPTIIERHGRQHPKEGCLSLPGVNGVTFRAEEVVVKTKLFSAETVSNELDIVFEGFEAVVAQHEIDHLDGKFFLDNMDQRLRKEAMREWNHAQNQRAQDVREAIRGGFMKVRGRRG